MAHLAVASRSELQKQKWVKWLWQSDAHLCSSAVREMKWCSYSDVQIAIIEEAYQKHEVEVSLDDYHINFKELVQISNTDLKSQRSVKRVIREREEGIIGLRQSRFLSESITISDPFSHDTSSFLYLVETCFNIPHFQMLDESFIPMLVQRAAEGLVVEGKEVGKQREGEWMAEQLLNVEDGTNQEIWGVCTLLYSLESFLYKRMNEIMRLIGDKHKQLLQTKALTFGPFAYLLAKLTHSCTGLITVYRGAQLPDEMITEFRQICGTEEIRNFPAFTSTSRSRDKAEQFGNVLFEIIIESDGKDIAEHSAYPEEEEVLLHDNFQFKIRKCIFNDLKRKWIIHLECLYW